MTGNENINLHGYGIDLTLYFDDKTPARLAIHPLMDEYMVPVCSPEYAERHGLLGNPANLAHCCLLHDRQAWGHDSDGDEVVQLGRAVRRVAFGMQGQYGV